MILQQLVELKLKRLTYCLNFSFRWFPKTERSTAVALAMAGFQLGSAIGLVLSPILMSQAGIFGPFVIFGSFGFLWLLVWISATSSSPDRSPQISIYELRYIQNSMSVASLSNDRPKTKKVIPPFRLLLSKLPTWSLIVANSMHSWVKSLASFGVLDRLSISQCLQLVIYVC